MSLPKINPTKTQAWRDLQTHFDSVKDVHLKDLFGKDDNRAEKFTISWDAFFVDFSKHRITSETISLLTKLAEEVKLTEAIQAQFDGDLINETENRAVLHTALRDFKDLNSEVKASLANMKRISEEIIDGKHLGYTGKPITDIVNIGIGGSHLGPEMVTEALAFYKNHLKTHFISNVDGDHVLSTLSNLNPETTLFIIVSKTFTTQETLTNASTAREWFLKTASEEDITNHFIAVSTNQEAVKNFGISEENILPMWDWVGGRFSLWSTVGLSICCSIGYPQFEALLKGAYKMDQHFKESSFKENIPVVLALLSIWYTNFFASETEAVIPYAQSLNKFVPYLQQAVMESNGKSVDRNGNVIDYQTAAVVWGNTGTNAQHAFFQLLHQGTKLIPADFICFAKPQHGNKKHHEILLANCFAQTEALMDGTMGSTVSNNHKLFQGNMPNTTLLIDKLTPEHLGSLLAMYEHKLFVQGIIWNIFSFDQWGVELGKKIAKDTLQNIQAANSQNVKNESTKNLLNQLLD